MLKKEVARWAASFFCARFFRILLENYGRQMRKRLSDAAGERRKFRATFSRFGKKINFKGYSEETILLINVIDCENGMVATSHIWFSYSKGFQKLNLIEGTHLEFEARVKAYQKGYVNKAAGINKRRTDFKLSHPTKVQIIPSPA
jgi:hypothetical protein